MSNKQNILVALLVAGGILAEEGAKIYVSNLDENQVATLSLALNESKVKNAGGIAVGTRSISHDVKNEPA